MNRLTNILETEGRTTESSGFLTWERRRLAGVLLGSGPDVEAFHEPYDVLFANEQVTHLGFMGPMRAKKASGLSTNLPGNRIVAWHGKAALKTHALQTLRDCRASPNRAKRLECVRFIGAFRRARDGPRFMVPMHSEKRKRALHETAMGAPVSDISDLAPAGRCLDSRRIGPQGRKVHKSRGVLSHWMGLGQRRSRRFRDYCEDSSGKSYSSP